MRVPTSLALGALALCAAGAPALAEEGLGEALARLRASVPGEERSAAVDAVLALEPSTADVRAALEAGLPRTAVAAGWQVLEATDDEGTSRPYHLYVPEKVVTGDRSVPLLVHMHGGVSRPVFIDAESFAGYRGWWTEHADREGFVVAMPLGRGDCTWWSDAGVAHVRATIRDAKRHAPVDDDRIIATGFSDGASGCYYLAMAAPDPFAAMLPLNGHPAVATGASGRQLYLENAAAMPLFVAMTQDDGLYPARSLLPHVQVLMELGAEVHMVSYPEGGHSPAYMDDQGGVFARFVMDAERLPAPDRLDWWIAEPEAGSVRWLDVTSLGAGDADAPAPEPRNVMSTPGRVLIGFGIDRTFTGSGVRVESVRDDSVATEVGLAPGDVIVSLDGQDVDGMSALRVILGAKSFGDEIQIGFLRGGAGEPVIVRSRFPPFVSQPIYPRGKATGFVRAERWRHSITIESHGVRGFRLRLDGTVTDLTAEVVVSVNGVDCHRGVPGTDVAEMVRAYGRQADRGRLIDAVIEVASPAGE